MRTLRIAMVQMNPTVGDLDGNGRRLVGWLREARKAKADLVAFPELAITGYPPEDLLLKSRFVEDNQEILKQVVKQVKGTTAVIGGTIGVPLGAVLLTYLDPATVRFGVGVLLVIYCVYGLAKPAIKPHQAVRQVD